LCRPSTRLATPAGRAMDARALTLDPTLKRSLFHAAHFQIRFDLFTV
jgi:hypothetical protein